ncbi:hypothetical protein [Mycobacterium sp. SMC-4]|uniref:hypothetical protein n=1 Tax=Mycobacterium sp. SMC-4 TaxID=2857059 RepID=UPI003CFC5823
MNLSAAAATAGLTFAAVTLASPAQAEPFFANYSLNIEGRYDFHTWTWAVTHCIPAAADCAHIKAIPMPIAKAFEYSGDAHLVDGRYTLEVDVPDGLRCGNVYYGPVIATRDVYTWDANTLRGTLTSSFAAGCDGAPGGAFTYPFALARL